MKDFKTMALHMRNMASTNNVKEFSSNADYTQLIHTNTGVPTATLSFSLPSYLL